MKYLILTVCFFHIFFAAHSSSAQPEGYYFKLWLWGDSSQLQIVDKKDKAQLLLFARYNNDKSRIEALDIDISGTKSHLFWGLTHLNDLKNFLIPLAPTTESLYVQIFGPRQVDPLGQQPTRPLTSDERYRERNKIKELAIFTPITWSQMRGIMKSELSQSEIDFLLFKKTLFDALKYYEGSEDIKYFRTPMCRYFL